MLRKVFVRILCHVAKGLGSVFPKIGKPKPFQEVNLRWCIYKSSLWKKKWRFVAVIALVVLCNGNWECWQGMMLWATELCHWVRSQHSPQQRNWLNPTCIRGGIPKACSKISQEGKRWQEWIAGSGWDMALMCHLICCFVPTTIWLYDHHLVPLTQVIKTRGEPSFKGCSCPQGPESHPWEPRNVPLKHRRWFR